MARENSGERKRPWLKFYPADWHADPSLRACSYAARGLWIDLVGLMHRADPYGHLLINGVVPDARKLARVLGSTEKEITVLLAELEREGVFSRADSGVIFCRRMVRDAEKEIRDRENGRTGGNPNLRGSSNRENNPWDKDEAKPGVNPPDNATLNGGDKAHMLDARFQNPASQEASASGAEECSEANEGHARSEGTPTQRLYSEGLPILARLMQHPLPEGRPKVAAVIGKLRGRANDDTWVLDLIREAAAADPADPVGWLMARLKRAPMTETEGVSPWAAVAEKWEDDGGVLHPVLGGVWVDVAAALVLEAAGIDTGRWRGDWGPLVGWLKDGIDLHEVVLPTIKRLAGRPNYPAGGPATLRYFDAAVRGQRQAAA